MNVLVSLVTRDDAGFLPRCLESVLAQVPPAAVRVVDCASRDGSAEVARRFGVPVREAAENLGYSRAHNRNVDLRFPYVLFLNADVYLEEGFVEALLEAAEAHPGAGILGGKLYRADDALERRLGAGGLPLLDSTGVYFTPWFRHFDRGSNEPDRGQFERTEAVFGITGAALLARSRCLEEIRCLGEYFDEDFFAYREDVDLSWRARLAGWECLYVPAARGRHFRKVLPAQRRRVEPLANYHSVKNRFLLRMKLLDRAVARRCFPYLWIRDLVVVAGVLAWERSSLAALREARRLRPRMLEKRAWIMARRRILPDAMAEWFSFRPHSRPPANR
ncbi:MAG: glycosyltransferase family 2 protein [Acidobacteriota bacterium]